MKPGPVVRVQSIQERPERSRPYYVRWTVDGNERGPRTFDTMLEADAWRSRLLVAYRDGEKWDKHTGLPVSWSDLVSMDVAIFARQYLATKSKNLKPNSVTSLAEVLGAFVIAAVPKRAAARPGSLADLTRWLEGDEVPKLETWLTRWAPSIGELDKRAIDRIASLLKEGVTANVIRRRFTEGRALLRAAVKAGALEAVELERPTTAELDNATVEIDKRYPTITQMLDVVEACQNFNPQSRLYRAATAVGVLAGCRPSEILGLERSHVESPESGWGEIRVTQAVVSKKGEIGKPKARRSVRTIPIHPRLVEEIRNWLEFSGIENGPLFRTRTGHVPGATSWGRSLSKAAAKAGVRPLSPYDLRRFHGTWLAESGVPYNEAARRMGHSLDVFMRVYVGVTEDVSAVANAALDSALEK